MNLLGITFLSLVFILLTEFNIILVLFIFLYDDPLEKMLLILFLEMLFPKGITIFLKIFSSIFPDISNILQNEPETNSIEYVVVIEDANADGGSELTQDLKAIHDQLQDDIRTNEELDSLETGFLRLSRVLAESKSDHPHSSYR